MYMRIADIVAENIKKQSNVYNTNSYEKLSNKLLKVSLFSFVKFKLNYNSIDK
jgi:hypothetical protein